MAVQLRVDGHDTRDAPDVRGDDLGDRPRLDGSRERDDALLDGDLERRGIDPERLEQDVVRDLALDLLVAALERADEVGAGDDADEARALDDRQAQADPFGEMVTAGVVMASPAVRASKRSLSPYASSRMRPRKPPSSSSRPCSLRRMSASETTPRTRPSGPTTGTPEMRWRTSSAATSFNDVSGVTVRTSRCMISAIFMPLRSPADGSSASGEPRTCRQ
jgi:hypothetical protein